MNITLTNIMISSLYSQEYHIIILFSSIIIFYILLSQYNFTIKYHHYYKFYLFILYQINTIIKMIHKKITKIYYNNLRPHAITYLFYKNIYIIFYFYYILYYQHSWYKNIIIKYIIIKYNNKYQSIYSLHYEYIFKYTLL